MPGKMTASEARAFAERSPTNWKAWKALGSALFDDGDLRDARKALEKTLALAPSEHDAYELLAKLEIKEGQGEKALELLNKAIEINPKSAEAYFCLALVMYDRAQHAEALKYIEVADQLLPGTSMILGYKSFILYKLHRHEEAFNIVKPLLVQNSDDYRHWNTAGNIKRDLGSLIEADEYYRKAVELSPYDAVGFSNRVTALHYRPDVSREEIFNVCKEWEGRYAHKRKLPRPIPKDRAPARRIRLGLLSDGFRRHPVGMMITSVLECLPKHGIELYAYTTNNAIDSLTQRIKAAVDNWVSVVYMSDDELAQQIREDQVDILVDLCGHNAGSRMQVVVQEPAPLIVKWVGGLINTTGLAAIDYLISDNIETPSGEDRYYTEKLIRLPDDYVCYVLPDQVPDVADLPALRNGYITLGCFNNPVKVNEVVLKHWAELMLDLPGSRLFLKGHQYQNDELRHKVESFMAEHGIEGERLIIEGPSSHPKLLDAYNRVDIALDPWPYSGGLTTCEAMLMGVPVVTLPGPTFAGRHSATHLVNAGMPELVAGSWEEYRARVVGLAADLESLATIRKHLREVLLRSPVCDAEKFAKHFAVSMRAIWQRYCEGKAPAALTLDKCGQMQFDGDEEGVEISSMLKHAADETEFRFSFTGKIVALDNGAAFAAAPKFSHIQKLGVVTTIVFDPASRVGDLSQGKEGGELRYHPHVTLGDGEAATLYATMDPRHSSTLVPLKKEELPSASVTGSDVLAHVPIRTYRLDDIEGLESVDWLVLDNLNDSLAVIKHGQRIIANSLLVQVRVSFSFTHKNQPDLARVQTALSHHGFVLHRIDNLQHSGCSAGVPYMMSREGSRLLCADAIFVPNEERINSMATNARMKLAFMSHAFYGMQDLSCELLHSIDRSIADHYLRLQCATAIPALSSEVVETSIDMQPTPTSLGNAEGLTKPVETTGDYANAGKINVVDIGANPIDGDPPYKSLLKKGEIRLVGFEPQKDALKKLNQSKGKDEIYLPDAVGDGREATLYICKAPGMTSTLKPNREVLDHFQGYPVWGRVLSTESIKTVRLDDVQLIADIDWLKIDIQGGELSVFKNGERKLKGALVIQTEVNFISLYENQPLFAEIDQWMRRNGFMLHALFEQRKRLYAPYVLNGQVHNGINQITTADAVYVRDINALDRLKPTQRQKMAKILREAYGSVDLANRVLALDRGVLSKVNDFSSSSLGRLGRVIHICYNNIHVQNFVSLLKEVNESTSAHHQVFVEQARSIPGFDVDISQSTDAYYFDQRVHLATIIDLCTQIDVSAVVVHGLYFDWQHDLIRAIGQKKKVVWVMWGGDLYNPLKHKRPIFDTVKNVHAVATSLDGDYEVFCRNYESKPRVKFVYSTGLDFTRVARPAVKERLIVVGNSGDPSNCHVEILKSLSSKRDIESYQILIPLAYNLSERYAAEIEVWLRKLNLASRTTLLKRMLPPEEYFTLVSRAEVVIAAHHRQQAVGNLVGAAYFGSKIILRRRIMLGGEMVYNPTWDLLVNEYDAKPYAYEEFVQHARIDGLAAMDEAVLGRQRSRVMEKCEPGKMKEIMRKQLDELCLL